MFVREDTRSLAPFKFSNHLILEKREKNNLDLDGFEPCLVALKAGAISTTQSHFSKCGLIFKTAEMKQMSLVKIGIIGIICIVMTGVALLNGHRISLAIS